MSDLTEHWAHRVVLAKYCRACIELAERIATIRRLKSDSSDAIALLRAYIILLKKWTVFVGIDYPSCQHRGSFLEGRAGPIYLEKFGNNGSAVWYSVLRIFVSIELSMISELSIVTTGERLAESDLRSFVARCFEVYHCDEEIERLVDNAKFQALRDVGYVRDAARSETLDDKWNQQRMKDFRGRVDYFGRKVEELYEILGLDGNIKEKIDALVTLFRKFGRTTSGTNNEHLSVIDY
jgi:hypothetical protein